MTNDECGVVLYADIMNVMAKMGWAVPANSKLQWRSLIAVMKQELNAPESPDYVFLFERLIQLVWNECAFTSRFAFWRYNVPHRSCIVHRLI